MKFVVDENVSYAVVVELRSKGHEILAISEKEYSGSSDREVFSITVREKAILITRDFHFTNSLRFPPQNTEGIICLRKGNLKAEDEVEIILNFMDIPLTQPYPICCVFEASGLSHTLPEDLLNTDDMHRPLKIDNPSPLMFGDNPSHRLILYNVFG